MSKSGDIRELRADALAHRHRRHVPKSDNPDDMRDMIVGIAERNAHKRDVRREKKLATPMPPLVIPTVEVTDDTAAPMSDCSVSRHTQRQEDEATDDRVRNEASFIKRQHSNLPQVPQANDDFISMRSCLDGSHPVAPTSELTLMRPTLNTLLPPTMEDVETTNGPKSPGATSAIVKRSSQTHLALAPAHATVHSHAGKQSMLSRVLSGRSTQQDALRRSHRNRSSKRSQSQSHTQRGRKGSIIAGLDLAGMISRVQSLRASRRKTSAATLNDLGSQRLTPHWIEQVFQKRECIKFIPSEREPTGNHARKCGCGRPLAAHTYMRPIQTSMGTPLSPSGRDDDRTQGSSESYKKKLSERWTILKHTSAEPTDAFGVIEFEGGPHPHKAHYVRLGFDSSPEDVMKLFDYWKIPPPKLVITVHGGIANFDLQPKLARLFRKGLMNAAKTTGAWIITSGINSGVVRHVASALSDQFSRSRQKIVSIGIAPWGLLKKRDDLHGRDVIVPYHAQSFSPKGRFAVLNDNHSYFLLVDNGTVGRYGADIILRKRLEEFISKKQKVGGRPVPVVCVVLEGGTCTVRSVLDYVTADVPVPVVVCDGSGRAADLLAFAHQFTQDDGTLPEGVKPQLLSLIQSVFGYSRDNAEKLLLELCLCVRRRHLVTVFRMGEDMQQDIDHAILTALLKGQNLSAPDQLALALAWNRVDIARSDIFVLGQEWPPGSLDHAMMEALVNNHVGFVKLLLENGVSMSQFLSIQRLEQLYNSQLVGANQVLDNVMRDIVKTRHRFTGGIKAEAMGWRTLPEIGLVIEKLIGGAYRSNYTSKDFRDKCERARAARQLQLVSVKLRGNARSCDTSTSGSLAAGGRVSAPAAVNEATCSSAEWYPWGESPFATRRMGDTRTNLQRLLAKSRTNATTSTSMTQVPSAGINTSGGTPVSAAAKEPSRTLSTLFKSALQQPNGTTASVKDPDAANDDGDGGAGGRGGEPDFKYPFNELLVWAVLTKRQEMARCMWTHGEEAIAKALVAAKLYKSLANEAADDYLEVELCDELRQNAEEFLRLSLELLEQCYSTDDDETLRLLTYELRNWGRQTCLSLAVVANHRKFLAHPCCQILLADLWHGGLKIRRHSNLKVIGALLMPLLIMALEFKNKKELKNQPQTADEHDKSERERRQGGNQTSSSDSDSDGSFDLESNFDEAAANAMAPANPNDSDDSVGSGRSKRSMNPLKRVFTRRKQSIRPGLMHQTSVRQPPGTPGDVSNSGLLGLSVQGGAPQSREHGLVNAVNLGNSQHDQVRYRNGPGHAKDRDARQSMYSTTSYNVKPGCLMTDPSGQLITGAMDLASAPLGQQGDAESNAPYNADNRKALPVPGAGKVLPLRKRFYEFYVAPITTFWAFALSYALFLGVFTFVCLVRTPVNPSVAEFFVIAYVVNVGLEQLRRLVMCEPKRLTAKMSLYLSNYWNALTAFAVTVFLIGLMLRLYEDTRQTGRVIYAFDVVLWWLRLLGVLTVHSRLGPYITMVGKMVLNMTYIITILLVVLIAFGIVRQSVTYPDEEWSWLLVRNIFYKPYFMLYGEVYAAEIAPCGDRGENCVVGQWIVPALMAVFMLIANILLINLLIAVFNNLYLEMDAISTQLWKSQRYEQVMEYESSPWLPPPLTIFCHVYFVIKWLFGQRRMKFVSGGGREGKQYLFDYGLKLFLDEMEVEKLHDFEEECMDDLSRRKAYEKLTSTDERIQSINDRTEFMSMKVNDLASREKDIRTVLREVDNRLDEFSRSNAMMLEMVTSLHTLMQQQQQQRFEQSALPRSGSVTGRPPPPLVHAASTAERISGTRFEVTSGLTAQHGHSAPPAPSMEQASYKLPGTLAEYLKSGEMPRPRSTATGELNAEEAARAVLRTNAALVADTGAITSDDGENDARSIHEQDDGTQSGSQSGAPPLPRPDSAIFVVGSCSLPEREPSPNQPASAPGDATYASDNAAPSPSPSPTPTRSGTRPSLLGMQDSANETDAFFPAPLRPQRAATHLSPPAALEHGRGSNGGPDEYSRQRSISAGQKAADNRSRPSSVSGSGMPIFMRKNSVFAPDVSNRWRRSGEYTSITDSILVATAPVDSDVGSDTDQVRPPDAPGTTTAPLHAMLARQMSRVCPAGAPGSIVSAGSSSHRPSVAHAVPSAVACFSEAELKEDQEEGPLADLVLPFIQRQESIDMPMGVVAAKLGHEPDAAVMGDFGASINSGRLSGDETSGSPAAPTRVNRDFLIEQNRLLREFEETSSRITGGLIGRRMRKETACMEEDEILQMAALAAGADGRINSPSTSGVAVPHSTASGELDLTDYVLCYESAAAVADSEELAEHMSVGSASGAQDFGPVRKPSAAGGDYLFHGDVASMYTDAPQQKLSTGSGSKMRSAPPALDGFENEYSSDQLRLLTPIASEPSQMHTPASQHTAAPAFSFDPHYIQVSSDIGSLVPGPPPAYTTVPGTSLAAMGTPSGTVTTSSRSGVGGRAGPAAADNLLMCANSVSGERAGEVRGLWSGSASPPSTGTLSTRSSVGTALFRPAVNERASLSTRAESPSSEWAAESLHSSVSAPQPAEEADSEMNAVDSKSVGDGRTHSRTKQKVLRTDSKPEDSVD